MITRYWAGITSSRSEVSSPITCIGFLQHGQFVSAGGGLLMLRCTEVPQQTGGLGQTRSRVSAALALRCWLDTGIFGGGDQGSGR